MDQKKYFQDGLITMTKGNLKRPITEKVKIMSSYLVEYPEIVV